MRWKLVSYDATGPTIQLIQATEGLAGWRLDPYVLALGSHHDLTLVDQLLHLHEVLLREEGQLATHFSIIDESVQLLGGLL